jgi:hypothetical protein
MSKENGGDQMMKKLESYRTIESAAANRDQIQYGKGMEESTTPGDAVVDLTWLNAKEENLERNPLDLTKQEHLKDEACDEEARVWYAKRHGADDPLSIEYQKISDIDAVYVDPYSGERCEYTWQDDHGVKLVLSINDTIY